MMKVIRDANAQRRDILTVSKPCRVLVTGANGFLGTWLLRYLLEYGFSVRALVRKKDELVSHDDMDWGPSFQRYQDIEWLEGDITNALAVEKAVVGCQAVFHLAGLIAYRRIDREKMDRINVGGTKNVVEACLRASVQQPCRLVHISSVAAIGASFDAQHILNEESSFNLSHLELGYFESKRQAEEIVRAACRERQLNAVILNPTTIYGGGDARKGSRGAQLKVAQQKLPFYTSGGVNVVSVHDVVECMLRAYDRGRSGERYIICGDNILIRDVFSQIAYFANVKAPSILLPNTVVKGMGFISGVLEKMGLKGGPISQETSWTSTLFHWFSGEKAQKEWGYVPRSSVQAIEESVEWMRDHDLLG